MAQALSTSSLLLSQKTGSYVKPQNSVIVPCMASFPSRKEFPRLGRVRAQASGDNKDNSVEVQHVNKGDHGTAVEKKPRRTSMDISPFGKFPILIVSTIKKALLINALVLHDSFNLKFSNYKPSITIINSTINLHV